MRTQTSRCFAIVPAAGSGSRMKSEQPKQYLSLLGQPLIRHTLAALCAAPVIDRVYVVLSVGDQEWDKHDWRPFGDRLVPLFCGGASRADSVLNGLRAIADDTSESDWILVHDAARPCLAPWHVESLVRELLHDEVGGILAVPVADTLKREDSTHRVAATVPHGRMTALAEQACEGASLWWGRGSQRISPGLLRCQGLPAAGDFAQFLLGQEGVV